jgi:polyhydroxyalkanoate synthesis repressor PhaR
LRLQNGFPIEMVFCTAQKAFFRAAFAPILRKERHRKLLLTNRIGKAEDLMPAKDDPVVIKKYANRRLYNTGTSTYVTLEDLAEMVKRGEEFTVQDAKTGEDITHPVLTQIIFELENKEGQNMLPVSFLRQLISFYGDQMQMIVPSFLEQSMIAFAKEQERFREQMKSSLGQAPMDMMKMPSTMKAFEEQTRRNVELFQNAMRMFTPFPNGAGAASGPEAKKEKSDKDKSDKDRVLQELKEQIAAMQKKLDQIGE